MAARVLHLRGKLRTGIAVALFAAAMVGVGFASAPLYRMFCQATGWNGTVQERLNAVAPGPVVGKLVNVRFDANVKPGMGWTFEPEDRVKRVAVGAREMAFFTAVNDTDHTITGSAAFNVSPLNVGQYFVKIQCFCFTEQTLRPHERVRMPVIFYVDPGFAKDPDTSDISEITLSYTFYPVASPKSAS
ncbi:cytochrome c oxidase assembly protein subunit 11 [Sphingomonas vulcanisoli]|uniref:Cytochrome c oxidase assembly protein CtaG n=1 Tax=Sphingomonas vulcanisoli TaxID=1658060 RepID=A0ABX0TSZ9_9SPHN|nr:cytochrome c oxidase assembly protein [Sphingomonas vulcanisoli]NIJ08638.1 cytochrome c oxidase assembly protein subunit 11 [Sphingomonas vulcanisoli]